MLDFLRINQTYIFAHDKGANVAAAMTAKQRGRVKRLGFGDMVLHGLGYETLQVPQPTWNLYSQWQLAFFSVPDAAQYFIQGREREMLLWYFYHAGYAGTAAVSDATLTRYADAISKPGYLRAGLTYFDNGVIAQDAAYFNATLVRQPFAGPTLVVGGEASAGNVDLLTQAYSPAFSDLTVDVVPKAGHWIGKRHSCF